MALKIYNTQTRKLEPFVTLLPGIVTMYCCGVTDNIAGIQQLIQVLLDKNYAYAVG